MCACGNARTYSDEDDSVKNIEFDEYVYNDNEPQYYTHSSFTVSEKGYYYILNNILHFYDVATDVDVALCSKLECSHDSSHCDAYVEKEIAQYTVTDSDGKVYHDTTNTSNNVNCVGHMIFYWNEHIYMVERDDNGDYLVRYDARFNNKERLSLIAGNGSRIGATESDNMTNTAFLMNGYLYYMSVTESSSVAETNFMTQLSCNRVKLELNAVPEKLGEFDIAVDTIGSSSRAMVYGINDNVYYITALNSRFIAKENCSQYRVAVFNTTNDNFDIKMHINSDNKEDVLGAETGVVYLYDCCIDDSGNLYAISKSGSDYAIWKFGLDNNSEPQKVYSILNCNEVSNLIYDGEYIHMYCTNNDTYKKLITINTIGDTIGTVDCTGLTEKKYGDNIYICSADGRYLVISDKTTGTFVYDMRNIGTTGNSFRKL